MPRAVPKRGTRAHTDNSNWWVNSSYAVHPDMHSHSGIYITLGKGAMYNKTKRVSPKQNFWLSIMPWGRYCGQVIFYRGGTCTNNHCVP